MKKSEKNIATTLIEKIPEFFCLGLIMETDMQQFAPQPALFDCVLGDLPEEADSERYAS